MFHSDRFFEFIFPKQKKIKIWRKLHLKFIKECKFLFLSFEIYFSEKQTS